MTRSWFQAVLTKQVILHLKDDNTIEGALMAVTGDGVILRTAELRNRDNAPVAMAGEVFIPRENIAFAQLDD